MKSYDEKILLTCQGCCSNLYIYVFPYIWPNEVVDDDGGLCKSAAGASLLKSCTRSHLSSSFAYRQHAATMHT